MELSETYNIIREGIVAFVPRYRQPKSQDDRPPEFPWIVGTGFIIEDGLIVTNNHVLEVCEKLPKPPVEDWGFCPLLFHEVPGKGMFHIPLDVIRVFSVDSMDVTGDYYGPPKPDIAFVQVRAKGLPKLEVDSKFMPLEEGREVATAGFPMGTAALMAPGYLHQITPTLQKGIISAVLPVRSATVHAFAINIMCQGGASGSPVFAVDSPKIVGILYGGLVDMHRNENGEIISKASTNISHVVPAYFIELCMEEIRKSEDFQLPDDTKTLDEIKSSTPWINRAEDPKKGWRRYPG